MNGKPTDLSKSFSLFLMEVSASIFIPIKRSHMLMYSFLIFKKVLFLCVFVCVYVCAPHVCSVQRGQKSHRIPRTEVTDVNNHMGFSRRAASALFTSQPPLQLHINILLFLVVWNHESNSFRIDTTPTQGRGDTVRNPFPFHFHYLATHCSCRL